MDEPITTRTEAVAALQGDIGGLVRVAHQYGRDMANAFSPGLAPAGFAVLAAVYQLAPAPPAAIIAHTQMDKSVVSRQLRLLKTDGHLMTGPDPSDGRARLYSLAPATHTLLEHILALGKERFGGIFAEWSDDDLIAFATYMRRLFISQRDR